MEAKAWVEKISIPTYPVGRPEQNPMFLEKRVYQGSSGVVYPHPVIEQISDKKTSQEYTAVFLENDQSDVNHQGAAIYLQMFPFFKEAVKQDISC